MTSPTIADRINAMLLRTDGRDKLMKSLGGAARVVFAYTTVPAHEQLYKSMSETRSIARMCLWVSSLQNIAALAQAPLSASNATAVLRQLMDVAFIALDNVSYLAKYGMLKLDRALVVRRSIVFLLCGFVIAALSDIAALAQLPRCESRARRVRCVSLLKNACDVLASLNNSKLISSLDLSHKSLGALGCVAGGISAIDVWQSTA
jgi:hypothetical protein